MTDIVATVAANPVTALIEPSVYDALLAHIKAEAKAFAPDLSTVSGRKEIAAFAYKVTRTKTAIDAAGKKLNEEARAQISKVDERRRKIRADLELLADEVRKPLTDWESAEEARVERCKATLQSIIALGKSTGDFDARLAELEAIAVDDLGEYEVEAVREKVDATEKLTAARAAQQKADADRAELDRLRKAEQERLAAEAVKAAEEEKVKAEAERKAAEERREAESRAEAERLAAVAAERAREEERRVAAEAIAQAEREKQALIDAQAKADADRAAEAARQAAEQAARDANKQHRSEVMRVTKEAIMQSGADEAVAKKIVLAIVAGEIPNVTLRF